MINKDFILKHIIITFFMTAMLLVGTAATASAQDEADAVIVPNTFDNVPWEITEDNELLIGEDGQEYTFTDDEERGKYSYPWTYFSKRVKKVIVLGTVHGSGSLRSIFEGFKNCTSMELGGLDTAEVTDMSRMFWNCENLISADVSGFNTSQVTNMNEMFWGCNHLTIADVSGFDTSQVTNMRGMFEYCNHLTSIDVSGFDTGNVTDLGWMFSCCSSLASIDVSGFDTGNVRDMGGLFESCFDLTSIDVTGFDTSKVKSMAFLFSGCGITSIDVTGFDTSKVEKMNYMFNSCIFLTSIDVSNFDTGNVSEMSGMFSNCTGLTSIDISNFDTGNVTDMEYMFVDSDGLTSIDVSNFDTKNVKDMSGLFMGCSKLTSIDVSGFNTANVESMNQMFKDCSSLTSMDISGFDTSNIRYVSDFYHYMNEVFAGCAALKTVALPVSLEWLGDNSFQGCENLEIVEISNLNRWCSIWFKNAMSNPLNASPNATLLLNGGTGSKATLEEGITAIPDRTFSGWKYLKEVTLPESLTKIGAGAFERTDSLRTVNVNSPEQWLSMEFATESSNPLAAGTAELRVGSGQGYDAPGDVVIDKTIGSVPAYAFSGCRSLRSVVIPDSVTTIGTGAFASCELLSQVVIPDSVSALQENVFFGCSDLKKILIPDSVTSIDTTAFKGCPKDMVLYGTPGSVAEDFAALQGIRFRDYSEYDAMQAGTITKDIRWILTGGSQLTIEGTGNLPDYAANYSPLTDIADKVTSIKIKGISSIGTRVFNSFRNLESVTIDINTQIESIDPKAFEGCRNVEIRCYHNSYDQVVQATDGLRGVTVKKLSGNRAGNVTWTFNEDTGTMLLTSGSEEFGKTFTESPFKDLNIRRVEFSDSFACKSLPANLFAGCKSVTEVKLAAQTTAIGDEVFKDCTNLRRITWHEGITKVGKSAFENCGNLRQVLLADSVLVNEYDQEMEDTCVEIPEGVKVIPAKTFRNCSSILQVDWYEDAEGEQTGGSIGASAFENCSALAEVDIPNHVANIGEAAFNGCASLGQGDGSLDFSENLNVLGAQAFYDCPQLLTMSFEKDPSSIGENALGTNKKLTVEAPESASNLKAYCRNAGMSFIITEGMGDTETQQDAYVRLAKSSVTVKAGKSKKIAFSTNGKVKGIKASGTGGKVSVAKSGRKVKFKGRRAKSGLRVSLKFDMKKARDVTKSVSVTVRKASSGLGMLEGEEQIIRASKKTVTFSSDAAASQKVRITRPKGAEGAWVCTASKRGIVKYTMNDDGTLKLTPVKAGKTILTIYAGADEVFDQSEPIRITATVKARPAKVTAKVKKLTKKKARVSWKKVNGVKSYQIQVSVKKNFKQKKTYTAKASVTKKVVKIKKGKTNYIRVRYKLANGKVGKWSTTLAVKK